MNLIALAFVLGIFAGMFIAMGIAGESN